MTVLHVEQEVTGDDTTALDSVLECDVKRHRLLAEEKSITATLHANRYRYFYFSFLQGMSECE